MEQDEADSFGILIGQLRGFANAENDKLVIGFVHPNGEPELRVAPTPVTAQIGNPQLRSVVASLGSILPSGTQKIGVVFPARSGGKQIVAVPPTKGLGSGLCAAGVVSGGVASVGLFRIPGGDSWREAHGELDWLCEEMRRFIGGDGIEPTEAEVFSVQH